MLGQYIQYLRPFADVLRVGLPARPSVRGAARPAHQLLHVEHERNRRLFHGQLCSVFYFGCF